MFTRYPWIVVTSTCRDSSVDVPKWFLSIKYISHRKDLTVFAQPFYLENESQRFAVPGPRAENWGKGNHSKVNETQWFLTLGHSNWTICSLLSWFCSWNFPTSYLSSWEVQLFITPERGRAKGGRSMGIKWGKEKGITQKWMRHRGFWHWGIQIGPFAAC